MPIIKNKKNIIILTLLIFLLVVTFLVSFAVGKYVVSFSDVVKVIFSKLIPIEKTWSDQVEAVIINIRLPRIIAAMLIGAALSSAGAAYQGLFQNPLVSPDILGASEGAGFGASFAVLMSFSFLGVSVTSFVFGVFAVLAAYYISTQVKANKNLGMVLAGIMISTLFTSAISFVKLVADTQNALPAITYWLMGSLASVKLSDLLFVGVPIVLCLILLICLRWRINIITMGEDEARTLGINIGVLRIVIVLCATIMTAASVAVAGIIGWVGLVVPHFARMIIGHNYKSMLPCSMLIGAIYLMLIDDVSRSVSTSEIPLGILSAFIGAPFFLFLILKRGDKV